MVLGCVKLNISLYWLPHRRLQMMHAGGLLSSSLAPLPVAGSVVGGHGCFWKSVATCDTGDTTLPESRPWLSLICDVWALDLACLNFLEWRPHKTDLLAFKNHHEDTI